MPTADELIVILEARLDRYEQDLKRAQRSFDNATRNIENNARRAEDAVTRSANQIGASMRSMASTIAAALSVQQLSQYADMWIRFTNQLKVSGVEGANLGRVQEHLFQIAQRYGVEVEALGQLYGRTSQGARELGATQNDLLRFTSGVSAAMKVQGASAQQSRGALIQLTQALGGEIVRAEEFNSINEGARPILQAVANGIDRYRGSVAALRRDVVEGRVSSQEFFQAFLTQVPQLEEQATRANFTISQAFTQLNNAIGRYVGQTDQSLSATARVAAGIKLLADNIDTVANALGILIVALGSRFVAAGVVAIATNVRVALSIQAFAAAAMGGAASVGTMGTAMGVTGAAASLMGTRLLAAMGGPVGLALTALTVGIIYLASRQQTASVTAAQFREAMENARITLEQTHRRAGEAANSIQAVGNNAQRATGQMNEFAGAVGAAARQLASLAAQNREAERGGLQTEVNNLQRVRDQARPELDTLRQRQIQSAQGRGTFSAQDFARLRALEQQNNQIETMIARLERRWHELDPARTRLSERDVTQDQIENTQGGLDAANEILRRQRDIAALQQEQTEEARRRVAILQNEIRAMREYQRLRAARVSPSEARAQSDAYLQRLNSAAERGNAREDTRDAERRRRREERATSAGRMAGVFRANGLSDAVIAGILGNIQYESGFNARAVGDSGTAFGHAQWRAGRVDNFQRQIGVHPSRATGEQSARFILWELQNPGAAGMRPEQAAAIRNARTPEEAADLFERYYERPARPGGRNGPRAQAARRFHDRGTGAVGEPGDDDRLNNEIQQAYQAEQQRLENVAREEAQLQDQLRQARRQLVLSVEEQDALAREDIELERQAYQERLRYRVLQGEITEAEAQRIAVITDEIAVARQAQVSLEQRRRHEEQLEIIARRALERAQADIANQQELAQLEGQLATTARERREVELRLLDLAYQREEIEQRGIVAAAQAVIASETATQRERDEARARQAIAESRLATSSQRRAGEEELIRRGNRSPMEEFLRSVHLTSAEIDEQFESIAASGLGALNDGLVEAIMGTRSLGEAFSTVANQIIADLLRIGIQRAIIGPLADALFGGDKGGGFLSGLFGGFRAGGGPVAAGRAYVVGEKRPELFIPGQSGTIVPRIPTAITGAVSARAPVVVQQTLVFDARGAVTTEKLIRDMHQIADAKSQQAGMAAYQRSMKDAPGAVTKARRYGTS